MKEVTQITQLKTDFLYSQRGTIVVIQNVKLQKITFCLLDAKTANQFGRGPHTLSWVDDGDKMYEMGHKSLFPEYFL